MPKPSLDDLKDLRDRFDYVKQSWSEIYEEGAKDRKILSGDPWTQEERAKREKHDRFCLSSDEITQYVNQLVNDVRQNPREVKLTPVGDGANDQTAQLRQGIIRAISFQSNAQWIDSYVFENMVTGSYGFSRVRLKYADQKSRHLECEIDIIPNPDTVYFDPDCKKLDCSDADDCFVIDTIPKSQYKLRYPDAEQHDFSEEDSLAAPQWIKDKLIQVAEYYKVKKEKKTLLWVGDSEDAVDMAEAFPGKKLKDVQKDANVTDSRVVEIPGVIKQITNGIEILEETPWAGKFIPIIPCFGKQMYVKKGSASERQLMSLVRLARDPYMLYCFLISQEAEEAAMSPRATWVGYKGQMTDPNWALAHVQPVAYLEAEATTEATGQQILALPTRPQWQPNFQSYEIAKEAQRRAIQSALGMYSASVGKHDSSVKSGKQQEQLDQQSSEGSFHFIDNFNLYKTHQYRVIEDLLKVYNAPRDVAFRADDDTSKVIRINEKYTDPKTQETTHNQMDVGSHEVTTSIGPSMNSQRDETNKFIEQISQVQGVFPIIGDLLVKSKNLGAVGDQIAKRLTPPQFSDQNDPAQQVAQLGQKLQQLSQQHEQLTNALNTANQKIQAKVTEHEGRMEELAFERQTKLMVAGITAKEDLAQGIAESLLENEAGAHGQMRDHAHEAGLQAQEQAHSQQMQQQQAAQAQQSQAADQSHQQQMAEQSQQSQQQESQQ